MEGFVNVSNYYELENTCIPHMELFPVYLPAPVYVNAVKCLEHFLGGNFLPLLQVGEVGLELQGRDVSVLVPIHLLKNLLENEAEKKNIGRNHI